MHTNTRAHTHTHTHTHTARSKLMTRIIILHKKTKPRQTATLNNKDYLLAMLRVSQQHSVLAGHLR